MVVGVFCLIVLVCVVMYSLMDVAKDSDRREEEIFKEYLKKKEETKKHDDEEE